MSEALEPRIVGPGFHGRVFAIVKDVPAGHVTTYGDVAKALGSVRVARHVGFALAACTDPEVPWHRVINSRGALSFPLGSDRFERQAELLRLDGVDVSERGTVNLRLLRWAF